MSRADPHISVLGAITITKRESGEEDCIQVYLFLVLCLQRPIVRYKFPKVHRQNNR